MDGRNFVYYRAGVAIARFSISADSVKCSPRDLKTMEYGGWTDFVLTMYPFEADLDKRLADSVRTAQTGALTPDHMCTGTVSGGALAVLDRNGQRQDALQAVEQRECAR